MSKENYDTLTMKKKTVCNDQKDLCYNSIFHLFQAKFVECRICRTKVHQAGSNFCQGCAYKKGICAMCGKKILDTKSYCQSSA